MRALTPSHAGLATCSTLDHWCWRLLSVRRIVVNRRSGVGPTRAAYDRTQQDQALRNLPVAPSPRAPPPPLPPIPPPAPPAGESWRSIGLATAVGLGIALLWNMNIQGQVPTVMSLQGVDRLGRPAQTFVVKTKGGNILQVSRDDAGRLFFVDMEGNLYYDSGIKEVGFYFVGARDNKVFNVSLGPSGESVHTYVGKTSDIVTARVDKLGGIPVEKLQSAFGNKAKPGPQELTFFYDPNMDLPMPGGAPVLKDKDGVVRGPPQLDEGVVLFERMNSWLPFSDNKSADPFQSPYQRGLP